MPLPLITLTTDFGASDHYVGTMKGVILSSCPEATIIDITHGVPEYSIWPGAYTIDQAAPFFPEKTIHVVVVDPGVGTERRAIVVEALGQLFVAPDNGVLSMIMEREMEVTVWHASDTTLFRRAVSATFHGRDIFAPLAARLACGMPPSQVGPRIKDVVRLPDVRPSAGQGRVLSVDHFGNVITNFAPGQSAVVAAGERISSTYRTFGEAPPGELFLYAGSSGFLEIGINKGHAAGYLGVRPGDIITLEP